MIERYALYTIDMLRDRFALPDGVPAGVKINYNYSATQFAPIIISFDGKRVMERHMWGFVPASAKDTRSVFRYKTTSAKSESAMNQPMWSDAIRTQRCLVPANGYYEWRKTIDGKRPFYVTANDTSLVAFAGIYSSWNDPEGHKHGTFAILTAVDDTNTGRSPIIIPKADENDWLDPDITDTSSIYGMMRPLSVDMLQAHKVTLDLKNLKRNDDTLLQHVQ